MSEKRIKVGMFYLTEEQCKRFRQPMYIKDFKNKADPVGNIIFDFLFQVYFALNAFLIICFVYDSMTIEMMYKIIVTIWYSIFCLCMFVVLYRWNRYHLEIF